MRSTLAATALLAAFGVSNLLAACSATNPKKDLDQAVHQYNDSLRWKRFAEAASYLPAELQADFLTTKLENEEQLHIDQIEVRGVAQVPDTEIPTYEVTLLAEAYVLPSTVVERVVLRQRWEQNGESWRLVQSSGAAWAEIQSTPHAAFLD